jgi:hypothetical protein
MMGRTPSREHFNRRFDELKGREQRQVKAALDRLQLRITQGSHKYGSWHGELVLALEPKCKCEDDEAVIVTVTIETRNSRVDDTQYVIGDYMIRDSAGALHAPRAYVMDLPFEVERAFMREAAWLVVDRTWRAVCALVPALAEVDAPTREEVDAQHFGAYAQRPGSDLPIRLM